jgi:outer membrane protein OmpA-like peptidoglycan-associated protein
MKKRIIFAGLIVSLLIIFTGTSFATLARIQALGFSDLFFKDIYHIYVNPAYLGMYTNYVYGELGSYERGGPPLQDNGFHWGQFGAVNYKIYKGLSLGITVGRGYERLGYEFFSWQPVTPWNPNDIFPMGEELGQSSGEFPHRFDFMTSYDWENLHLGIGLYNAREKETYKYWSPDTASTPDTDWDASFSTTGLTFGGLFNFGEEKRHSLEGMFSIRMDKGKEQNNVSQEKWESTGGTGIGFGARAFLGLLENIDIIPVFGFSTEKISAEYTDAVTPANDFEYGDYKHSWLFFGLGANWKLDKGMVAGGLTYAQETFDDKVDTTYPWKGTHHFVPAFNLGVEYGLTKWLDARIGMYEWFGKDEYESRSDGSSRYKAENLFDVSNFNPEDFLSFGLGLKFSKFRIDGTIYEKNFFEGSYLLSGISTNVFGTLSATFFFGGEKKCPPLSCIASGNPTSGAGPLNVQFNSSVSGGCPGYTYSWDFGDGGSSSDPNPNHTYQNLGNYTAKLTVVDSKKVMSQSSVAITVACPPLTCTASGNPTTGTAPLNVQFSGSVNGGCPGYTYSWDFGDGETSTEKNPSHEYKAAGSYTAKFTVTDSQGNTQKSVSITITASEAKFVPAPEKPIVLQGVNFEFNKAILLAESKTILDEVASSLKERPDVKVEIGGHCDSVGSNAYNLKLSQKRAEAVREYLISKGVKAENLTAKGYGESMPIAPNSTAEGRAQNRRVELKRI